MFCRHEKKKKKGEKERRKKRTRKRKKEKINPIGSSVFRDLLLDPFQFAPIRMQRESERIAKKKKKKKKKK